MSCISSSNTYFSQIQVGYLYAGNIRPLCSETLNIINDTEFGCNVTIEKDLIINDVLTISKSVCNMCEKEGSLSYEDKSLCLQCIFDCVFQHHARVSWIENNGDPIKLLKDEINDLKNRITLLESNKIKDSV